jgi:hypothetical protein
MFLHPPVERKEAEAENMKQTEKEKMRVGSGD